MPNNATYYSFSTIYAVALEIFQGVSAYTCLPLKNVSLTLSTAKKSYFLDKFRERFSNGAVTGPPHKQNKTKQNMCRVNWINFADEATKR